MIWVGRTEDICLRAGIVPCRAQVAGLVGGLGFPPLVAGCVRGRNRCWGRAVCVRRRRSSGGGFGWFRSRRGGSRVLFRIGPGNRVYGRGAPVEWRVRPGRGSLVWVGRRRMFACGRSLSPPGTGGVFG